jgi:serine/threonine-protein kinase RsbW
VGTERVTIAIPAAPEYVRIARLAAAGLASRIRFNYDEVEDVRMAVDELCYLLVGPDAAEGSVTLTFDVGDDAIAIVGEAPAGGGEVEFAEFSTQILRAVVDEFEIVRDAGAVKLRVLRRHHDA